MRNIKYILTFLIVSLFMINPVNAAVDTSVKVYDEANVLSYSEKQQLQALAEAFVEEHGIDIVLLTSRNKYHDRFNHTHDFYDYGGFGKGKTRDGLIYLIDLTEGNYYLNSFEVRTFGEAIRIYDDYRIERIHDAVEAAEGDNDYYGMFAAFIQKADEYADSGVADSNKNTYIDENGDIQWKRVFPWGSSLIISLIVATVVVGFFIMKNKMIKKATRANEYLNKESVNFTKAHDSFVGTHTSRIYIPRDSGGGGGGGRIGGSSTRSGSSGRSSGGGSRR